MEPVDEPEDCWDFLDINFINRIASSDFDLPQESTRLHCCSDRSSNLKCEGEFQPSPSPLFPSKTNTRERRSLLPSSEISKRRGIKASREKLRREKLKERYAELSSVLEPSRSIQHDKPSLLDDAIRALNNLRQEAEELKASNEKLVQEIESLKEEKNEIREEKVKLKSEKEGIEVQLKGIQMPSNVAVYSGYGFIPLWQYLPPSVLDTSDDHHLRPPAA